jgi:hypothetical protein
VPAREDPSFEEAWMLASAEASEDGAATLGGLIARADVLNHAIPSASEIRSALERLSVRGLVRRRGRAVQLTQLGRDVLANAYARRGGLFAIVGNVQKALGSPKFRLERAARRVSFGFVTEAAVARAYAAYRRTLE